MPARILNIESKFRSNLFPWRGQFSPQLVEALLLAYAPAGATVLDPFMGSGTTLIESARLGHPVYGFEINPAAYLLARVYELCGVPLPKRYEILRKTEAILAQARPSTLDMPLFRCPPTTTPRAASLLQAIRSTTHPQAKALLEALVVLLDGNVARDDLLAQKWATIRRVVLSLPYTRTPVHACFGDARRINLPDAAIDFVLSSPPYINVFNYHHNSRAAIESLGWRPLVVARSEIGANRKFRQNRFLTVIQYCMDMALVLLELTRVCKKSARVILVLGRESNVHKTAFYNGQILEYIAVQILNFRLHLKQERVFVNRFGQRIHEDILHLSPELTRPLPPRDIVIERARNVGKQVLLEAAERTPLDRRHFLEDALARVCEVEPSPILETGEATGGRL